MKRDNYLCQICLEKNRIKRADVVHHIKELRDSPSLAYDEENLIAICHACHNKIHKSGEKEKEESKKDFVIEFEPNEEIF